MPDLLTRLAAALGDRYSVERELGAGGMALVYLARDLRHHRHVAIKVLRPELAASLGSERFLREIEVAAGLQHPHIVPLYDSGAGSEATGSAGVLYYVMPFVEGESLRERLRRDPRLPLAEATRIASEVARALAYAHGHGVVHRDIKPENILVSGGHALVADFGIARAIDTSAERRHLTGTGLAVGTPMYMSPEQATAGEVDARTDQYALACVLYEMLAGTPPFTGSTPQAIVTRTLTAPPPDLRSARADVPVEVEGAVSRALAREPAERFPSMQEFADALAGSPPERGRRLRRRHTAFALGLLLLAGAGGAVTWLGLRQRDSAVTRGAEVIAVLPFRTSGPGTGLMSEGMVDLLSRNLDAVGSIRTVDPRSVLSRWSKAGAAHGDLNSALGVGRALGAGSVLMGSVVAAGNQVRLTADLRSLGGQELARAQVEGPADSVLPLVDRLSFALLRNVWRSNEPVPYLRVSAITTQSADALRFYLQGEQYYRRTRFDSALVAFNRAVESDSTFALAHFRRAVVYGWSGGYASQQSGAAAAAALRFSDRLPDRDRALLHAYNLFEQGKPSAADTLRRHLASYPHDVDGWYLLGEVLFHSQPFTAAEPSTILAAFDSVLSRDSTLTPAMLHPMELAIRSRDSVSYARYEKRFASAAAPETAPIGWAIRQVVWGEVSDSALAVLASGGPVSSVLQALYLREDATSDLILRTGSRFTAAKRLDDLEIQAFMAAGLGRLREARRYADSIALTSPEAALPVLGYPILLGLAQEEYGGHRIAEWRRNPPPGSESQYFIAMADLAQRRITPALRRIDSTLANRDTTVVPAVIRGQLTGARGWALLLQGDTVRAFAEFRRALEMAAAAEDFIVSAPWRFQFALALAARPETRVEGIRWLQNAFSHALVFPLTRLALGRVYQSAGDRQAAAAAYTTFVRLWDKADPELQPYVREARAALRDLRD
jgi:serine/threonine-protein kinase